MKTKSPFRSNPFTQLPEIKLVDVPPPVTITHEQRIPLRSYLTRADDPLRSLAEALSGGRKPKTVEVTRTAPAPEPEETAAPTQRWGR